uniref:Tryptophan synthase alpha chain n=1 Tax=Cyanidium caldarium TaxID=2771 RepID=TRPA1_CYACA|nr:tryptophan synthase alpha subunit [Cyanidium caldarium]Q9TLW8.1 RecName: Full=Tryptophan synthase alpha chain [Cyanidium caldarium]AAF12944.1 unknown [Cyanidium caldarium]WDB00273.1 tryptophan synthase alpha subunit [Cyanidium caldarium]
MKNSIKNIFESERGLLLLPFVSLGTPNTQINKQAIIAMDKNGANIIELGIPYSDPVADGPVIQDAYNKAIKNGVNIRKAFKILMNLKGKIKSPIIVFIYYNQLLNYGINKFLEKLIQLEVQGIIVPDLPYDESQILKKKCTINNIALISLIALTSSFSRIKKIARNAEGFLYLISKTGVTGGTGKLMNKLKIIIKTIQKLTSKPVVVGFGINSRRQIKQLIEWNSNGIVIGSPCVQILLQSSKEVCVIKLSGLIKQIKESTSSTSN